MNEYSYREVLPQNIHDSLPKYSELLRSLLYYRGISTSHDAEEFLNPSYTDGLSDPFLMKDMDKAVDRILRAIKDQEHILIYSDYDADGIPAAVVLSDFFELIGYSHFEIYIPHRHKEGYGLHHEAILGFKDRVKLMITLDCGIVDCEEVAAAQAFGIDVIVTDHHVPGKKLPPAYAILNAKQDGCAYPDKMLCGAGVGFKLIQGLIVRGTFNVKDGAEKWLLDMVGLATLSDMVPLRGENRVLAHYGLKVLRKSRRPGLLKLFRILNMDQRFVTEDDIGFMITPRINAASRMGIPTDAFQMLATKDEVKAQELASYLDGINKERKGLVGSLVKEIKKIMTERADHFAAMPVIVLGNPEWRPAILGLAANSLTQEHHKPVFLWGREDGVHIKGSCRSEGVTHLVHLMESARSAFHDFGGHAMSGGFSVLPDAIHGLEDALVKAFKNMPQSGTEEKPQTYIDAILELDAVNASTYKEIEKLAPFGIDNPKPLFIFKNIIVEQVRMFGKKPEHLELTFSDSQMNTVKAIGFFMKPEDFELEPQLGKKIDLLGSIEKSSFRGKTEIRLRIVDVI